MKRERLSIAQLRETDVETIANKVKSAARSYERIEGMKITTAIERAMSDFQFWYQGDEVRQKQLEEMIYELK